MSYNLTWYVAGPIFGLAILVAAVIFYHVSVRNRTSTSSHISVMQDVTYTFDDTSEPPIPMVVLDITFNGTFNWC
jgi:hypothetical protein